jgi:hypothetical protein
VDKREQVAVAEWENGIYKMGCMYKMQLDKLLDLTTEQFHQVLEEKQK